MKPIIWSSADTYKYIYKHRFPFKSIHSLGRSDHCCTALESYRIGQARVKHTGFLLVQNEGADRQLQGFGFYHLYLKESIPLYIYV